MLALIETVSDAPALPDTRQAIRLRLKQVFRNFPGAIVVRTERHHDPRFCLRVFCAGQRLHPLVVHCEDGATETAVTFSVYEAYVRHLARLAAENPDGWTQLPAVFWQDPDRFNGYCEMPISLAA